MNFLVKNICKILFVVIKGEGVFYWCRDFGVFFIRGGVWGGLRLYRIVRFIAFFFWFYFIVAIWREFDSFGYGGYDLFG